MSRKSRALERFKYHNEHGFKFSAGTDSASAFWLLASRFWQLASKK